MTCVDMSEAQGRDLHFQHAVPIRADDGGILDQRVGELFALFGTLFQHDEQTSVEEERLGQAADRIGTDGKKLHGLGVGERNPRNDFLCYPLFRTHGTPRATSGDGECSSRRDGA